MSIAHAKLKKNDVIEVYTQTALVYDLWGSLTETKARQMALEMAQIKDGMSVLEVAIGTGLTFQEILKANPNGRNIGVDLTPAMLEKARSRIGKLGLANDQISPGDAYDLKFPDNQFDLLMNNYMFDLLPEVASFFPKLCGRLALRIPSVKQLVNWAFLLRSFRPALRQQLSKLS